MMRSEFAHAIRAAGAVLGVAELLVIGSQAIHGSVAEDVPLEAARSIEVDLAVRGDVDGRFADLIDGSIGEASMFHDTFGYYAQGVVETTAVLPSGWSERLVRFETAATHGVVAWCLELHDLWIAKAVAGREKDRDFCRVLLERGLVGSHELRQRLEQVSGIAPQVREAVAQRIP